MRLIPDVAAEGTFPDLLHRLRNPLAALTSGISLVMHVARPTGETLELLQQMLGEIGRLDATTRETQRYFTLAAGHPEPADVAQVAGDARAAVQEEAARAGVGIELDGGADESVMIDPEQLRFSLVELLANAIRASEPGGRIRVSWHRGRMRVERIEVEDAGRGVPDSLADEIGKPFFTTFLERTGLGLATVAKISRLAGGALRWENVSGGGCRFVLEVPVG
jgi:signal transduction histidine kinase